MHIDSLRRYPIKGLSAETLSAIDLTAGHGVELDRVYAVTDGSFDFDPANPQPMPKSRFLMLAKYERLALLKTHLDPVTHGVTVDYGGERRIFRLREPQDRDAFASFLAAFLDTPLPGQAKVAHSDGHQFTDVSVHSSTLMRSVSLINLATIRDLEDHVHHKLDPLRFRANIYFDGAQAWSELDWVGRQLRCGDVLLEVVRRTRRCPATSVDLDAGVRDINVPIAIRDYRNHGDCGIYADVLSSGRLAPGDRLELVVGA